MAHEQYRTPNLSEFINGFKYEAKTSPTTWDEFIYPQGFSIIKGQMDEAIKRGMVRVLKL